MDFGVVGLRYGYRYFWSARSSLFSLQAADERRIVAVMPARTEQRSQFWMSILGNIACSGNGFVVLMGKLVYAANAQNGKSDSNANCESKPVFLTASLASCSRTRDLLRLPSKNNDAVVQSSGMAAEKPLPPTPFTVAVFSY